MRSSYIRVRNYTAMDKEEFKQIVKAELERIHAQGVFPTTANYAAYKTIEAPTFQTILKTLAPMKWKQLLEELNIRPRESDAKPSYSRGWTYYTTETLLEKTFDRMRKLDNLSFADYDLNRGLDAPPISTVLKRLDCKWNDLVQMYIERYGYTDNLTKERNVAVPLTRYNELIAAEKELKKLKEGK